MSHLVKPLKDLNDINILYIASASRSGSTILEHSLGALEGVINVGELRRLKDFYNEDETAIHDPKNSIGCTCGKKIRDCNFWLRVEKETGLDFSKVRFSSQINSINRSLFKLSLFIFGPRMTKWLSKRYRPFAREIENAENCFRIYLSIAAVTKCRIIVDSSKMIHQFLMLYAAHPENVKLVGLVRDGRAVSKSMTRGDRINFFKKGKCSSSHLSEKLFKAAVLSWVMTIMQMLLFYFRMPQKIRYFTKYEDFCRNKEIIINDIAIKFGFDNQQKKEASNFMSHAIGGSPSRFHANFRNIEIDDRWRKEWSKMNNRIFMLNGGVINKILGYD